MKKYNINEFITALIDVGIQKNDIVHIHNKLFKLGVLENAPNINIYYDLIYEGYFSVIGNSGSIVVGTYTTNCGRFGDPFVYENSYCINGGFNEYLLKRKDSLRSLHPINSFTAAGRLKNVLCTNNGISNYGLKSPVGKFVNLGAKLLFVGDDYSNSVLIHYIEQNYGLPYCYNKLLDIPFYKNNELIHTKFTANVRYLHLNIELDKIKIKSLLDERKLVHSVKLGDAYLHSIYSKDYIKCCLDLIENDPFGLLKDMPNFVKGEIPFDGPTYNRDGVKEGSGAFFNPLNNTF